ncbi:hypothetical protein ACOPJQ_09025 [Luteimonas dalianensis]|uniref:hypothetical protein n=1 Tax=Luteimonas dalianensis TaxID=1148196 RepID=UPI003BF17537
MAQTRHKVVVIKPDPAEMEKEFDRMAVQGWELVSLSQVPILSMVAVFRKTGH